MHAAQVEQLAARQFESGSGGAFRPFLIFGGCRRLGLDLQFGQRLLDR